MLATFQTQHFESFKLFFKNGSTSVLCCILHPGLKTVVIKVQLDVDVIVLFFSRLCCDLAPLRSAFIHVLLEYSLRLS
jgi:hypothetical protein